MKSSKLLMTVFVVVMVAALTFTTAGAQAELPPTEEAQSQDASIGVDAAVVQISPNNSVVYTRLPTFVFRKAYNAIAYSLQVREMGEATELYTYSAAFTCTDYVCWMRPTTKLNMWGMVYTGEYEWRITYREGTLWHVYSSWVPFLVHDNGFNSTFDLNAKNWFMWEGDWVWDPVKGRIWTYGDPTYFNSMFFNYKYLGFDYTVRMKRKIAPTSGNNLVVWGVPGETTSHAWESGYYISYRNDGYFFVSKVVDGAFDLVGTLEECDAIVPFGWNEIRVVGMYPYLDIWVNGVYQGYITLTEIPFNYFLGFDMYTAGTADDKFLVDWAKASVPSFSVDMVHDPAMELIMRPVAEGEEPFN